MRVKKNMANLSRMREGCELSNRKRFDDDWYYNQNARQDMTTPKSTDMPKA